VLAPVVVWLQFAVSSLQLALEQWLALRHFNPSVMFTGGGTAPGAASIESSSAAAPAPRASDQLAAVPASSPCALSPVGAPIATVLATPAGPAAPPPSSPVVPPPAACTPSPTAGNGSGSIRPPVVRTARTVNLGHGEVDWMLNDDVRRAIREDGVVVLRPDPRDDVHSFASGQLHYDGLLDHRIAVRSVRLMHLDTSDRTAVAARKMSIGDLLDANRKDSFAQHPWTSGQEVERAVAQGNVNVDYAKDIPLEQGKTGFRFCRMPATSPVNLDTICTGPSSLCRCVPPAYAQQFEGSNTPYLYCKCGKVRQCHRRFSHLFASVRCIRGPP
jgi:hypothetical protein